MYSAFSIVVYMAEKVYIRLLARDASMASLANYVYHLVLWSALEAEIGDL